MTKLGPKSDVEGNEFLEPINFESNEPLYYPNLSPGYQVICGMNFGKDEVLFVCHNFRDMGLFYSDYKKRRAKDISWYIGPYPEKIKPTQKNL